MNSLIESYQKVKSSLIGETRLLCVSKTRPAQSIEEIYHAGQRDFAENKVQELTAKSAELSHLTDINWHFIGPIQSNKINQLLQVKGLVSIHSIGSLETLKKFLQKNPQKAIGLFLQFNTSGEKEKSGFTDMDQAMVAVSLLAEHPDFYLQGLMTMGRIRTEDFEADARASFLRLSEIKAQINSSLELSMGMSADYKIAMEFKTNWVRIGSEIFTIS